MDQILQISMMDKRNAFFEELIKLARIDEKIILIVPDVGFSFTEGFQKEFPNRYYNFGVTEQGCVVIGAALALSGFKVYIYSMINFVLFRPAEMIRNAVVHHKANVKLIGVKGSEKYKFLGFSHNLAYPKEDIDMCRVLGIACRVPETEEQTRHIVHDTYKDERAMYIRL